MKRTIAILIMVITVALIGIPLLINYLGNIITIKTEASFGDWLGFWGSYLGGGMTLLGVYVAFYLERKQEIEHSVLTNSSWVKNMQVLTEDIKENINKEEDTTILENNLDVYYKQLYWMRKRYNNLHPKLQNITKTTEEKVLKAVGDVGYFNMVSLDKEQRGTMNVSLKDIEDRYKNSIEELKRYTETVNEKLDKLAQYVLNGT